MRINSKHRIINIRFTRRRRCFREYKRHWEGKKYTSELARCYIKFWLNCFMKNSKLRPNFWHCVLHNSYLYWRISWTWLQGKFWSCKARHFYMICTQIFIFDWLIGDNSLTGKSHQYLWDVCKICTYSEVMTCVFKTIDWSNNIDQMKYLKRFRLLAAFFAVLYDSVLTHTLLQCLMQK